MRQAKPAEHLPADGAVRVKVMAAMAISRAGHRPAVGPATALFGRPAVPTALPAGLRAARAGVGGSARWTAPRCWCPTPRTTLRRSASPATTGAPGRCPRTRAATGADPLRETGDSSRCRWWSRPWTAPRRPRPADRGLTAPPPHHPPKSPSPIRPRNAECRRSCTVQSRTRGFAPAPPGGTGTGAASGGRRTPHEAAIPVGAARHEHVRPRPRARHRRGPGRGPVACAERWTEAGAVMRLIQHVPVDPP